MIEETMRHPGGGPLPYPLQDLVAALWDAGWKGYAPRGWLSHAHVGAERDGLNGAFDALWKGLELELSPALALAARLVCRNHDGAGPRPPGDLDVAEDAIMRTVADKARSERLRRAMGLD